MRYPYFLPSWRPFHPLRRALALAALGLPLLLPAPASGQGFTVVSTTPARHATAAVPTDPFSLNFSYPVNPATWDGITVFASSKHAINNKGTGATNHRVLVTPAAPLRAGEEVSVTVPQTVWAITPGPGAVLFADPYTFSFRAAVAPDPPGGGFLSASGSVDVATPTSTQLSDLDGNGFLDAVVTSTTGGYVEVLLNSAGLLLPSVPRRVTGLPGCAGTRCVDVDNDGDADLIVWSPQSNLVWCCRNDGTAHFGSPQPIGSGWNNPTGGCVADFDADGDLDVAIANTGANEVVVCSNDAGTFVIGSPVSSGRSACPGAPVDIAAADMNNDGAPDVVAACRDNGQIAILLWQLGQLGLNSTVSTGAGSQPSSVACGDVNRDGRCDFVATCAGTPAGGGAAGVGSKVVVGRCAAASFAWSVSQTLRPDRKSGSVILADREGDGDLDIITVDEAGGAVTVCRNIRATGTYSDGTTRPYSRDDRVAVGLPTDDLGGLACGDLDNDGDLDFALLQKGREKWRTVQNDARVPVLSLSPPSMGFAARPLDAITLRAGAELDPATFGSVVVRDNHGVAFKSASLTAMATPGGSVSFLLPAIQKIRESPYRVTVPAGGRTLSGAPVRPFTWTFDTRPRPSNGDLVSDGAPLTLPPGAISTMADYDGDGTNDLVSVSRTPGCISCAYDVKKNEKARTVPGWGPAVPIPSSPITDFEVSHIRCADLDGDGHPDLVLAGLITVAGAGGGPHVKVFDGATGTLVETGATALSSPATDLLLADLNHDGVLDIVTPTTGGDVVCTFTVTNIGGVASSLPSRSFPGGGGGGGVYFNDNDSDDDGYLYYATSPGGGLPSVKRVPVTPEGFVHVGGGTAGDQPTEAVALNMKGSYPVAADLDGDGLAEAIVASPSQRAINTNGHGIGRTFPTGTNSNPTKTCVGDLDGDDDRDVVVLCPGNNTLWIGINDGAGTLTGRVVSLPATPADAWLNDCDDDRRADLVVRCTDGSVHFFETGDLPTQDLIISDAQTIIPDTYRNITVLSGGEATIGPAPFVVATGAFRVKAGGAVKFVGGGVASINASGSFVLEDGGQVEIPQAGGLHPTTGPIRGAGSISLSPNAAYAFTGTGAQETGPGLPAMAAGLLLGNDVSQLTITNPVAVYLSKKGYDAWKAHSDMGSTRLLNPGFVPAPGTPKKRLISNGHLTLGSGPYGTATLDVRNIQVIGDATVQTYVAPPAGTTSATGYHHYAPPVQGTTYGHVMTSGFTPVVNPLYNSASNPAAVRPYPTLFTYDEARASLPPGATSWTTAGFSFGYVSPDALGAPSPLGRGWSMVAPSGVTWSATGTIPPGDVTLGGLTYTSAPGGGVPGGPTPGSGWHELGNPYPAVICWDSIPLPAGLSGAVWVWESAGGANGRYLTRANGMGTLPGGLLGVGQGFWVQVTNPAVPPGGLTLIIPPTATTQIDQQKLDSILNLIRRGTRRPRLQLELHGAGMPADATTVYFEAGATAAPDDRFDAVRPGPNVGAPTLASLAATSTALAVNGLDPAALAAGTTVELLLTVPVAGTYALRVGRLEHFGGQSVQLLDRLTGTRYDLAASPTVPILAAQAGPISGRFAVEFNGGRALGTSFLTSGTTHLTLYPNPASGVVRVSGAPMGQPVCLLDGLGRVVRTVAASTETTTLSLAGLAPGVYVVRSGSQTRRLAVE